MKSILRATACIVLIMIRIYFTANTQTNVPTYQLGVSIGTFVYQGDLAPSALGSYKTVKPVVNLFASKIFNPVLSVRANLAFGGLKGDDSKYDHPEYRQQRNFNFRSSVVEITGIAEWNVLGKNYTSRGFSPYVFAGLGYNFLKIRRDWSNFNTEYFGAESEVTNGLTADAQRSVPKGLLVFPVGIGVRYYLSDRIGIGAETSYRISSTDYLDGFSQSANPAKKDHFYSNTIGIVYRIGKKNMLDCPVVKY